MTIEKTENFSEISGENASNRQLTAPSGENESSTGAPFDTRLTQACSPPVRVRLNPAKTIKRMLQMRSTIGADTKAGHRISNIDEIRQNQAKAAGDPVREAHLDASMTRQLRDLAATRHPK